MRLWGTVVTMKTYTRSDGVRLRYLDDGEGMAILFMPGSAGTHGVYDPQVAPLLAAGYRVVRVDREGRGESDWGEYCFSGFVESRDAWAILDELGIEKAVLVGRSSGSGVIRVMYLTHPERVIGLVSIDSSSFGKIYDPTPDDLRTDHDLDWGLDPRFDAETEAAYHRNKAALQKIGRLWDHPSDFNTAACTEWFDERIRLMAEMAARPPHPENVDTPEPPKGDKWCRVPLLNAVSGRGRVGPNDPEAIELSKNLPAEDVTLVVVKNTGHWVNVEAVELFNRELLAFLGRLRGEREA